MNDLGESLSKYNLIHKGKVRNIYEYASDRLLIVTTDRISAFDFVFEGLMFMLDGAIISLAFFGPVSKEFK